MFLPESPLLHFRIFSLFSFIDNIKGLTLVTILITLLITLEQRITKSAFLPGFYCGEDGSSPISCINKRCDKYSREAVFITFFDVPLQQSLLSGILTKAEHTPWKKYRKNVRLFRKNGSHPDFYAFFVSS